MNNNNYQFLDWDSNFFGINIGKILIRKYISSNTLDLIKRDNLDLLYIFIEGENENIRNNDFGRLVDIKFTFRIDLKKKKNFFKDPNIKIINSKSEKLYDLAFQSGYKSRFKIDSNFKVGEFERFYRIWIDNSINGQIADFVLGYFIDSDLHGFITLKINNEIAEIGLFAVDEKHRNKGIGRKLIEAAQEFALNNGAFYLDVATQKENLKACKFYSSNGFSIINKESIYHKWFKK